MGAGIHDGEERGGVIDDEAVRDPESADGESAPHALGP